MKKMTVVTIVLISLIGVFASGGAIFKPVKIYPNQLLENGDFENGLSSWDDYQTTAEATADTDNYLPDTDDEVLLDATLTTDEDGNSMSWMIQSVEHLGSLDVNFSATFKFSSYVSDSDCLAYSMIKIRYLDANESTVAETTLWGGQEDIGTSSDTAHYTQYAMNVEHEVEFNILNELVSNLPTVDRTEIEGFSVLVSASTSSMDWESGHNAWAKTWADDISLRSVITEIPPER